MKRTGARLALLGLLLSGVAAVTWLLLRNPTPDQEMSLSVFVDRGTEAMQTVDRFGMALTRVSVDEEVDIGREIAARIERRWPTANDLDQDELERFERKQDYLEMVVRRLAEQGDLRRSRIWYTARLVPSAVKNAFALPGGYLYMTTGLLDLLGSEAEVAAVMGHEIAHVDLKHCIEQIQYRIAAEKIGGDPAEAMVSIGSFLWRIGFADEQEAEADRQGVNYAVRAGYHPDAAISAQRRIESSYGTKARDRDRVETEAIGMIEDAIGDYFATHPPTAERIVNLERALSEQHLDVSGTSYYLGRKNLQKLVPRSRLEFPEEFLTGRLPDPTTAP